MNRSKGTGLLLHFFVRWEQKSHPLASLGIVSVKINRGRLLLDAFVLENDKGVMEGNII